MPGPSDGSAPYVDAWRFLHPLYDGTGVLGDWAGKEGEGKGEGKGKGKGKGQGKGEAKENGKAKENAEFKDPPVPYTYWSMRSGAYHKNVGWRLDYFVVSPALLPALQSAKSHREVLLNDGTLLSDHCPVEIEIEL